MSLILLTIIAAIIAQFFGFLWYGPLFGKNWGMACGMSEAEMKSTKPSWKQMMPNLVLNFIANLAYAFVLFNLLGAFGAFTVGSGLRTGAIVFVGFVLPMLITSTIWNGRSVKSQKTIFAISLGYQVLNLVIWAVLFALLA